MPAKPAERPLRPTDSALEAIYRAVIESEEGAIESLVRDALEAAKQPHEILDKALIAAMDEIGRAFASGEVFVPEMLLASRVMQAGLAALRPALVTGNFAAKGTVVLATVFGDVHDIGKNLVATMLEGGGFRVIDLGVNVDAAALRQAIAECDPDVVGLSALLTTSMPFMAEAVRECRQHGLGQPIIVGGAPVSQEFADKIGADGYAADAAEAVILTRRSCGTG